MVQNIQDFKTETGDERLDFQRAYMEGRLGGVDVQAGRRVRATDVDHIRDHRGDWALFTDRSNLQSLCHSCHSRKTMREQGQIRRENGGFS